MKGFLKDIWSYFFSVEGRLSLVQYWRRIAVLWSLETVVFLVWAMNSERLEYFNQLVLGAVLLISAIPLTVRRYHDMSMSGWWVLIIFGLPAALGATRHQLPLSFLSAIELIVGIAFLVGFASLIFGTGDKHKNGYGASPNEFID